MIVTVESVDRSVDEVATLNLKVASGNVSATVEIINRPDHADRLIETIEVVKHAADSLEPGPATHELLSVRHGDLEMCCGKEPHEAECGKELKRMMVVED